MNHLEKITVIVPIYNVEKYLDKCVESIIKQTYKNLEIILVDDGSSDDSTIICDKWAERDLRIKVIHKKNGGLSDARNAGLESATGEYIAFVDSDDWIEKKYIEYLYLAIIQTGAELSACEMRIVEKEDNIEDTEQQQLKIKTFCTEEAIEKLISGHDFRAVVWNKLYKKEILSEEKFELGKLHEDEFFTYRIIDKCSSLVWIDKPLYNYRQRAGSIMSTYTIRHLDALEAGLDRLNMLRRKYPRLYLQDKVTYCISCLNYYCDMLNGKFGTEQQMAKNKILKYRSTVRFSIVEWFKLPLKSKVYTLGSSTTFINMFARARILKGYT